MFMIYFIVSIVLFAVVILFLNKRKPGKNKRKKTGFVPDFSGMNFSGKECECV